MQHGSRSNFVKAAVQADRSEITDGLAPRDEMQPDGGAAWQLRRLKGKRSLKMHATKRVDIAHLRACSGHLLRVQL